MAYFQNTMYKHENVHVGLGIKSSLAMCRQIDFHILLKTELSLLVQDAVKKEQCNTNSSDTRARERHIFNAQDLSRKL